MKASVSTAWAVVIPENTQRAVLILQNNSDADIWISFADPTGQALDYGLLLKAGGGSMPMTEIARANPTTNNIPIWARHGDSGTKTLNYEEL
jgi:hypothetical protein